MDTLQSQAGGTAQVRVTDGGGISIFSGGLPLNTASARSGMPPGAAARAFLRDIASLLGIVPAAVDTLEERRSFTTGSGLRVVEFAQLVDGVELFNGRAKVTLDTQGRVFGTTSRLRAGLALNQRTPSLSEDAARKAAYVAVGQPAPAPIGADKATFDWFNPPTSFVAFPTKAWARLAYVVQVQQEVARWYTLVDAATGAILYRQKLTLDAGPEGLVFEQYPGPGIPPNGQVLKPFVGNIDAQHNTWMGASVLSACTTCTNGNNVLAQAAQNGNAPSAPPTSATLQFNYPWTNLYESAGNNDADTNAAVASVFYNVNVIHDWWYHLGFNEAAGNYQNDNFGLGGLGGDPVQAQAQFGADNCPLNNCIGNANFTPTNDGTPGLMRMFLFAPTPQYPGDQRRDGSVDGDLITHEYAHGLSTRLIGTTALYGTQSGAMGEGWSDYWADTRYNDPVMGEYVTGNAIKGIRTHSSANHPKKYGDLCNVGSRGCEVHDDGEIWSATLWDLRAAYVAAGLGAPAADQVVFDGMAGTPIHPSMLDARDAIIAAESASPGGLAVCAAWTVFAAHGMGYSATSSGDSSSVVAASNRAPGCGDKTIGFAATSAAVSVGEGGGAAVLILERTGPLDGDVQVTVKTANGTATATDYIPLVATVQTIFAGRTRAALSITIAEDAIVEPGETFTVTLSNPGGGAALGLAVATVTIIDNDAPAFAGPAVAIPDDTPAGATATFTVSGVITPIADLNVFVAITHPFVGDLNVTLIAPDATEVVLINHNAGSYRFCSGRNISAKFDDEPPANLTPDIACNNTTGLTSGPYKPSSPLSALNGKSPNGTWTLKVVDSGPGDIGSIDAFSLEFTPGVLANGGTLTLGSAVASIAEGTGPLTGLAITRTGGSQGAAVAYCATTDNMGTAAGGADFAHIHGLVQWADGEASTKFCPPITIANDGVTELSETFTVHLVNVVGAARGAPFTTAVTILGLSPNPATIDPDRAGAWGALWTGATKTDLDTLPPPVTALISWFNGGQSFRFWFRGFPPGFQTLNTLDPGSFYFFQVTGPTSIAVLFPDNFLVPAPGVPFNTVQGATGQLWTGSLVTKPNIGAPVPTGLPAQITAVFGWDNPAQLFRFWFRGFPDNFNTLDSGLVHGRYYFFQDATGGTVVPTP